VIAVEWVGLCGSDAEEYLHGPVVISPPVTLGHEIVGVVARPAADGSGPAVGTRVVVDVVTGCGICYWCQRHEEGLCPDLVVTGQHVDGGLAEYVAARAARLIPVPENLDARHAALAEPLSVAVRAARKAGSLIGKSVVVIGGGTVGMLTGQLARTAGAHPVVIVEPNQARRELIGRWDVATAWEVDRESRRRALLQQLPERGCDVVFECSGRPGMTAEALQLARRGGTVLLLGVLAEDEPIDTLDVVLGEKIVHGSSAHMWDDDVAVAVDLLASRKIDVAPMITHTISLEQTAEAFEILTDPTQGAIKLLVRVEADPLPAPNEEEGIS
jgi:2-desacetyl-2-hydroxyethyl bacteriochlorophyllide A dehydrogenase